MKNLDKYLHLIGEQIQITPEKYEELNKNYQALAEYIENNHKLSDSKDISIYQQGSFAIDTVVKPLKGDEFDVDMVVEFDMKKEMGAIAFYNELYKTFEQGRYSPIVEKYRNNIRINYKNNYHFDIMPSIPVSPKSESLNAPDLKKEDWVIRSPKLFAKWFLERAKQISVHNRNLNIIIKAGKFIVHDADVSPLAKPTSYENKAPLNRVVQLFKRARDVYFYSEEDFIPQSVVITTLVGSYYSGEYSIAQAFINISIKLKQLVENNIFFDVLNPVCSVENFTEKWKIERDYYDNFKKFILFIHSNVMQFNSDSTKIKDALRKLFGDASYNNLIEATKSDSFWSTQTLLNETRNIFPNEKVEINKKERRNA